MAYPQTITITPKPPVYPAVKNVRITADAGANFTLTWDAAPGAVAVTTKYRIFKLIPKQGAYAADANSAFKTLVAEVSHPTVSVVIAATDPSELWLKVRAVDTSVSPESLGYMSDTFKVNFRGADTMETNLFVSAADGASRAVLHGLDPADNQFKPIQMDPVTGAIKVI